MAVILEYRREWELHRVRYCVRGVADIDIPKELEPMVLSRLGKFMGTVLSRKNQPRHSKEENKVPHMGR